MKPARYLEARYIQLADAASTKLENVDRPAIPEMTEPERADHERLLHETLFPLRDAGCRILEKRSAPAQMKNGKNEPVEARIVIGPIKIPLNAPAFELRAKGGLWARGVKIGERFYVMPGSEYCLVATKSLTRSIVIRRNELEKQQVLAPIKGFRDRKRLLAWLDCGSDAIRGQASDRMASQPRPKPATGSRIDRRIRICGRKAVELRVTDKIALVSDDCACSRQGQCQVSNETIPAGN